MPPPDDGSVADSSRAMDDAATARDAQAIAPDHVEADAAPVTDAAMDALAPIDSDASLPNEADAGAREGEVVVRARSINGAAVRHASGDDFFVLYAIAEGGRSEVRLVRTNGYGLFVTTVLARAEHPNLAVSSGSLGADYELRAAWYNGAGGIDVVALDNEGRVTARLPRSLTGSAGYRDNRLALSLLSSEVVFEGAARGESFVRHSTFDLSGGTIAAPRVGTIGDERQRSLPSDVRSLAIAPGAYAYTRGDIVGTAYVQWLSDWAQAMPPVLEVTGVLPPARVQSLSGPSWGSELDLTLANINDNVSQHRARFSRFSVRGTTVVPATLVASNVARIRNEAAVLTANQSANGATGVAYSNNESIQWRPFDPADGPSCLVTRLPGASWRGFALAQRGARNKIFVAIASLTESLGATRDELHLWSLADGEGLCGL